MEWNWANILQWVTTVIAVYAAILSTFNTWYNYRRDKKKLLINVEVVPPPVGDCFVKSETQYAIVTVTNTSFRPITIVEIGFTLTDGEKILREDEIDEETQRAFEKAGLPLDTELPCKLAISESASYVIPTYQLGSFVDDETNDIVDTFVPYALDSENESHQGASVKLDMNTYDRIS